MVAELTALRDQIDEVDKALLALLARRLDLVAEVAARVGEGMRRSEAVAAVAKEFGVSRRELYALVVAPSGEA